MNTKKFSDKVALVTGGTSGIGKTTAIEFARAGAKVVLSGRREKEGESVVAEIQQLGGAAAFIRADVARKMPTSRRWSTSPSPPMAASTSLLTTPALSGWAHWIRPPRPNTAAFSTSTFGAFSIRCVTKFLPC